MIIDSANAKGGDPKVCEEKVKAAKAKEVNAKKEEEKAAKRVKAARAETEQKAAAKAKENADKAAALRHKQERTSKDSEERKAKKLLRAQAKVKKQHEEQCCKVCLQAGSWSAATHAAKEKRKKAIVAQAQERAVKTEEKAAANVHWGRRQ